MEGRGGGMVIRIFIGEKSNRGKEISNLLMILLKWPIDSLLDDGIMGVLLLPPRETFNLRFW